MSIDIKNGRSSSSSIDEFFKNDKRDRAPEVKVASAKQKIRVASVNQLTGFSLVSSDTLVRVSQQDFWHLGKDESGYFIEKLIDDDAGPVKG